MTLTLPGGQNDPPPVFFPHTSVTLEAFSAKILAIPKLNIDKLKNVLKFQKNSQVFGGKSLKIGVNWEKINHIFTFSALIYFTAVKLWLNV